MQSFTTLQAWATKPGRGAAPRDRVVWAFDVVRRLMPSTTCLCQALGLQRLLARHGHASELKIGVCKTCDDFRAHAWLVHDGQVLVGGPQSEQYQTLHSPNFPDDIASSASGSSHPA
jgi:hypothetical protein